MPARVDPVITPSPFDNPNARGFIQEARRLLTRAQYQKFKELMHDMRTKGTDLQEDLTRVIEIMNTHRTLIEGYVEFLPPGFKIEYNYYDTHDWYFIRVVYPTGQYRDYQYRPSVHG
ncbi:hypothetical protein CVT24_000631 [Panaeolus cyanescens]|uniref:Uncharacterized protein n=1 Tax=Panaeolus cyanescens TaxID=181874 RepID=A0A409WBF4_9AGAR|nr:hypothetical protein CVT24_000631 [Panaeolus cyanescens]